MTGKHPSSKCHWRSQYVRSRQEVSAFDSVRNCSRVFAPRRVLRRSTSLYQAPPTTTANAPQPLPTPSGPGIDVPVPGGTAVRVSLAEPLSSGTARQGDTIPIVVSKDVIVNGMLIAKKGAGGQATISQAVGAGGNGSGGRLALSVDWVFSVDGGKILLSSVNHSTDTGDSKGAASTATLASYLILGPLGLFAHNFVRGRDVTIGTDKVFEVYVDHDVHVRSDKQFAADAGFDK
jgi:hypothetical protein